MQKSGMLIIWTIFGADSNACMMDNIWQLAVLWVVMRSWNNTLFKKWL